MREYELTNARWHKSSYSDGNGGDCVEVAGGVPGVVPVRDSKVADGPVVLVGPAAWAEFLRTVGSGRPTSPGPRPLGLPVDDRGAPRR